MSPQMRSIVGDGVRKGDNMPRIISFQLKNEADGKPDVVYSLNAPANTTHIIAKVSDGYFISALAGMDVISQCFIPQSINLHLYRSIEETFNETLLSLGWIEILNWKGQRTYIPPLAENLLINVPQKVIKDQETGLYNSDRFRLYIPLSAEGVIWNKAGSWGIKEVEVGVYDKVYLKKSEEGRTEDATGETKISEIQIDLDVYFYHYFFSAMERAMEDIGWYVDILAEKVVCTRSRC